MNVSLEGWVYLALSLPGAWLLDLVVTRLLLEILKPTSAWVFRVGRAGKIAAALGWMFYVALFWYPRFVGGDRPVPDYIHWAIALAALVLVGLAAATMPRRGREAGRG